MSNTNGTLDPATIWTKCKPTLIQIPDQWLNAATISNVNGETCTIVVKIDAAKLWLERENNAKAIERSVSDEIGYSVKVLFELQQTKVTPVEVEAELEQNNFGGFDGPTENWSKMPNALIGEHFTKITSLSEMKVVLYIIRHTWGYHEDERRISLDEFMNGRKNRNGERIDNGTGMSKNSIKDGIKRAKKHGLIVVDRDERDKARIVQYYSVKRKADARVKS